ncbi:kinase-regulated stress-responsive transcription factor skn7 [Chytriomyces hyalinus]|nr:kinase-regulated stress-responsive transcription factor skn7 [Chytriomyces hyalinus]
MSPTPVLANDGAERGDRPPAISLTAGPSVPTGAPGRGNVSTGFVGKLYGILANPAQFASAVCWSHDGASFEIVDLALFSSLVLPLLSAHRNYASFVRQLNKYQFKKIKKDSVGFETPSAEFKHPHFRRDAKDSLHRVTRVKAKSTISLDKRSKSSKSSANANPAESEDDEMDAEPTLVKVSPEFNLQHLAHSASPHAASPSDHPSHQSNGYHLPQFHPAEYPQIHMNHHERQYQTPYSHASTSATPVDHSSYQQADSPHRMPPQFHAHPHSIHSTHPPLHSIQPIHSENVPVEFANNLSRRLDEMAHAHASTTKQVHCLMETMQSFRAQIGELKEMMREKDETMQRKLSNVIAMCETQNANRDSSVHFTSGRVHASSSNESARSSAVSIDDQSSNNSKRAGLNALPGTLSPDYSAGRFAETGEIEGASTLIDYSTRIVSSVTDFNHQQPHHQTQFHVDSIQQQPEQVPLALERDENIMQVDASTTSIHDGITRALTYFETLTRNSGGESAPMHEGANAAIVPTASEVPSGSEDTSPSAQNPEVRFSTYRRNTGGADVPVRRALIVDDDAIYRKIVAAYLTRLNFVCDTATTGREAVRKAISSSNNSVESPLPHNDDEADEIRESLESPEMYRGGSPALTSAESPPPFYDVIQAPPLVHSSAMSESGDDDPETLPTISGSAQGVTPYDLIVMDIMLPTLNGLQATRQIREYYRTVPIIALTCVTIAETDRQTYRDVGMTDILTKPLSFGALVDMVDTYFV